MTIFRPIQWVGFLFIKKEANHALRKVTVLPVVIALGGNALGNSPQEQLELVKTRPQSTSST